MSAFYFKYIIFLTYYLNKLLSHNISNIIINIINIILSNYWNFFLNIIHACNIHTGIFLPRFLFTYWLIDIHFLLLFISTTGPILDIVINCHIDYRYNIYRIKINIRVG